MKCPDTDVLIAFARHPNGHEALGVHLAACPGCAQELEIIEAFLDPVDLAPLSEDLVDRVMAGIPAPPPAPTRAFTSSVPVPHEEFARGHGVATFLLAFATSVVASVHASGTTEGLPVLLVAGTLIGIVAARVEPWIMKLED